MLSRAIYFVLCTVALWWNFRMEIKFIIKKTASDLTIANKTVSPPLSPILSVDSPSFARAFTQLFWVAILFFCISLAVNFCFVSVAQCK